MFRPHAQFDLSRGGSANSWLNSISFKVSLPTFGSEETWKTSDIEFLSPKLRLWRCSCSLLIMLLLLTTRRQDGCQGSWIAFGNDTRRSSWWSTQLGLLLVFHGDFIEIIKSSKIIRMILRLRLRLAWLLWLGGRLHRSKLGGCGSKERR